MRVVSAEAVRASLHATVSMTAAGMLKTCGDGGEARGSASAGRLP
jgi:hypothetical protein